MNGASLGSRLGSHLRCTNLLVLCNPEAGGRAGRLGAVGRAPLQRRRRAAPRPAASGAAHASSLSSRVVPVNDALWDGTAAAAPPEAGRFTSQDAAVSRQGRVAAYGSCGSSQVGNWKCPMDARHLRASLRSSV